MLVRVLTAVRDDFDLVAQNHSLVAVWAWPAPASPEIPSAVIPGYTHRVKTAFSVPDDTFDRASARAQALGISRSEFFATAARHYLDELDAESVTRQIDAALDQLEAIDESTVDAVANGHRKLAAVDDEW
jgi:hypothetical protein